MGKHDMAAEAPVHSVSRARSRRSTVVCAAPPASWDDTHEAEVRPLRTGQTLEAHPELDGHVKARTKINNPGRLRRNQVLADTAAVAIGLSIAWLVGESIRPAVDGLARWGLAAAVVAVWVAALAANKLYAARYVERASEEFRRLLIAGAVGVGAMVIIAFFTQVELLSRAWIAIVYASVTAMLLIERTIARQIFARLRASGRLTRRIAIIGVDGHAKALLETIRRNPSLGYEVVGFIGQEGSPRHELWPVLGGFDEAVQILRDQHCVGAMISSPSVDADQVNRLARTLTDADFHVALSTGLCDIDLHRLRPQRVSGQALLYVEPTIRTGWRWRAKRTFDVLFAAVALALTAPIVAVAAIVIKLESEGPVFFRQKRVGRDGVTFEMIKLRTMYADAEARKAELFELNELDGPMFKIKEDPRVTRVGKFLRRYSIDEFPQFWNVLRGDMSVVGPRPALPDEVVGWDGDLHGRLRVLPGITGLWQVSGRSNTTFEQYKRLDLYYVDNWSLIHDLNIVIKTFTVVLFGKDAV
jgi:exopolysaccharide biosynthesis polyprenyl glycosylphosphotransferase